MEDRKHKNTINKVLRVIAAAVLAMIVILSVLCIHNSGDAVLSHLAFLLIFTVTAVCIVVLLFRESHFSEINAEETVIRNLLSDIEGQDENIVSGLCELARFTESGAAFFIDSDGSDHNYTAPEFKNLLFLKKERVDFNFELFKYIGKRSRKNPVFEIEMSLKPDKILEAGASELSDFMIRQKIENIYISVTESEESRISILGVINPGKQSKFKGMLKELTNSFSIAVRNRKYLYKTERVALIDALTGLFNRMMFDTDLPKKRADLKNKYIAIYIDVNELHIFNHKYGHEAGDKMLLSIADIICDLFRGDPMYRIGGDEFLILAKNMALEDAEKRILSAKEKIAKEGYNVSVGIAERTDGEMLDKTVKRAESKMYEEKSEHYHQKYENINKKGLDSDVERMKTGIAELDNFLSVMCKRCNGVYSVDIGTDKAKHIIAPGFFREFEDITGLYSKTFYNYVIGMVKSDYHRVLLGLTLYSTWEKQRRNKEEMHLSYEKTDGSKMSLTIYPLSETETVWMFENK